MSEELVKEAEARPTKEQAVIDEAKGLFLKIDHCKQKIINAKDEIKISEEQIKKNEKELQMLREGKYKLMPAIDGKFWVKYL